MDDLGALIGDMPDPAWASQGICATHEDPDLWFPEDGQWKKAAEARALCRTCPVQDQCALFARDTNQRYGVWGGISAGQRRQAVPA